MTNKIIPCQVCGVMILSDRVDRPAKFCSRVCSGKAKRKIEERECQVCGQTFRPRSLAKAGKYCSMACRDKAPSPLKGRTSLAPKNCKQCGNEFISSNKMQRDGRAQENYYCSRTCYAQSLQWTKRCKRCDEKIPDYKIFCSQECKVAEKRPKHSKCKNCSVEFQGLSYRVKRSGEISVVYRYNATCSDECQKAWLSNNEDRKRKIGLANTKERSPHWKGGATALNSRSGRCAAKEWKLIAEKARKRDRYTCQHCGEPQGRRKLDVHHIIPYHNFPTSKAANKLSNLITLCPSCHKAEEHRIVKKQMLLPLWEYQ